MDKRSLNLQYHVIKEGQEMKIEYTITTDLTENKYSKISTLGRYVKVLA